MKIVLDEEQLTKILSAIDKIVEQWKRLNDILEKIVSVFKK